MNKLQFPVAEGSDCYFPGDFVCPMCKERRVGEPHEFVGLSGGAASADGEPGEGFFAIFLHPREDPPFLSPELANEAKVSERGATVEIVRDTRAGQFDLLFCSATCLRAFFTECVDELERRLDCVGA